MVTVIVRDNIEFKENMAGSQHAPGVVALFDGAECQSRIPGAGYLVEVHRPDGKILEVGIDEMKEHGTWRSFFFGGLRLADVPVGSQLVWEDDSHSWRRASMVEGATK